MSFPKLNNKLILAPMEEISNLPFRLLCRKYGAAMAYTQQLSSLAITRDNPKTLRWATTNNKDTPVGLQLFGRNPEILVEAANKCKKGFDVIDLNFGCPSKKIVAQGYGSALLKEKGRIKTIIETLVKEVDKPITVKMRSGFQKVEAVELAKVMEQAGVSAITIHARTQAQKYTGKADWQVIKQVKEAVTIPVIGNGDVDSPEKAKQLLKETGCDYIMIGRAAMTNPLIFRNILHYFKTEEVIETTTEEKINLCFEYFSLAEEESLTNWKQMSQHFTKGIPGAAPLRDKMTSVKTKEVLRELLEQFKPTNL